MNYKQLFVVPIALLILGPGAANAGKTVEDAGVLACATDKWDEKEPEKGHKLVDMAARCVAVPDDPAAPKYTEYCVGKYEFMPDESWKGAGTCTFTFKDGDKIYDTIEEGSHLKEFHVQNHRGYRQISRCERWRYLFVREPDGHPLWRQIQRQDATALNARRHV